MLEESYEVLDALGEVEDPGDADGSAFAHLEEELGDLLFQIVFHARLAEEEGRFTLADVARGVHDKLVHRHPHVFGDVNAATAEEVVSNWEEIKQREKGRSSVTDGIPTRSRPSCSPPSCSARRWPSTCMGPLSLMAQRAWPSRSPRWLSTSPSSSKPTPPHR